MGSKAASCCALPKPDVLGLPASAAHRCRQHGPQPGASVLATVLNFLPRPRWAMPWRFAHSWVRSTPQASSHNTCASRLWGRPRAA